mgnify:CR=1 FL=1
MRTIADAFNEFFNKTGIGIKDLIDSKLDSDSTIAYATRAGIADSATNAVNATKATQDSAGNQINTTYATKSEIATIQGGGVSAGWVQNNFIANSGTQTLDGSLYIPSREKIATDGDMLYLCNKTHALALYEYGNTALGITSLNTASVTCHYEFKSDGIYLNNTKITN